MSNERVRRSFLEIMGESNLEGLSHKDRVLIEVTKDWASEHKRAEELEKDMDALLKKVAADMAAKDREIARLKREISDLLAGRFGG